MEIYKDTEDKFLLMVDKSELEDLQNASFYAFRHWDDNASKDLGEMKETDRIIANRYLGHYEKLYKILKEK